ncbi:MAG: hypothetical protein ACI4VP_04570 [Clostridia bacterium]
MTLKSNKGFALADTIIAIFVLVIFSTLVISISYNIYISSNFVKRNGQATNYIVEVFEYAKTLNFDDVNATNLVTYINTKGEKIQAIEGIYSETADKLDSYSYTMFISMDEASIAEEQRSYIKKIDITVMYKLGTKTKTVSMSTLINK